MANKKDNQTNNSSQDTTYDRKLKTKQYEPHKKLGVISGAPPEG